MAKQILSKSFASIAIAAIIVLFAFVITMDFLKYVLKIDPVDRERKLMQLDRANKKVKSRNRGPRREIPPEAMQMRLVS